MILVFISSLLKLTCQPYLRNISNKYVKELHLLLNFSLIAVSKSFFELLSLMYNAVSRIYILSIALFFSSIAFFQYVRPCSTYMITWTKSMWMHKSITTNFSTIPLFIIDRLVIQGGTLIWVFSDMFWFVFFQAHFSRILEKLALLKKLNFFYRNTISMKQFICVA